MNKKSLIRSILWGFTGCFLGGLGIGIFFDFIARGPHDSIIDIMLIVTPIILFEWFAFFKSFKSIKKIRACEFCGDKLDLIDSNLCSKCRKDANIR